MDIESAAGPPVAVILSIRGSCAAGHTVIDHVDAVGRARRAGQLQVAWAGPIPQVDSVLLEASQLGVDGVIIDLRDVEWFSSPAVGNILRLAAEAARRGGEAVLAGRPREQVCSRPMDYTFGGRIKAFEVIAEAVAYFAAKRSGRTS